MATQVDNAPPLPHSPADPPLPPDWPAAPGAPLPPLPNSHPPSPPLPPGVVALAPLPINGRDNSVCADALTAPMADCSGDALAASANAYAPAPAVRACTNRL
ncbi:Uncharacterised protein [Mycobacterium tuberculosis]|nr:Uncharacterised protein [Mycobacterium tuberculosis]